MEKDIEEIINEYNETLYRVAYINLKSKTDAEDIVQDVLVKYMTNKKKFKDEEHRKNWLIRVTINLCINLKKSAWWKKVVPMIDESICLETEEQYRLLDVIDCLKDKYKVVVQLFYFEDLPVEKISKILGITEENVRTRLNRARNELRKYCEEGDFLDG